MTKTAFPADIDFDGTRIHPDLLGPLKALSHFQVRALTDAYGVSQRAFAGSFLTGDAMATFVASQERGAEAFRLYSRLTDLAKECGVHDAARIIIAELRAQQASENCIPVHQALLSALATAV